MSSMLEQAIIDANALKEAAIKNAEQEVLEKYSQDIKEAVDALLEQEDPFAEEEDLELEPEMPMGDELPIEPEPVLASIPPAATGGEKLCPCPEDDIVEIDLEGLMQNPEMTNRDELAEDIALESAVRGHDDEEIDLQESDLRELVEDLTFEYEAKPTGWTSGTPVQELEQEQLVAKVAKEIADARKENEDLKENLNVQSKQNNKFKRIILQLKDKLDEVSASNARLLYTNRVLGDNSLNERQKTKIVETISKAQTIEEAKMIYRTLQSAVDGASSKAKGPKSLNEAVSRQSTRVFSRHKRSGKAASDPAMERMQRLAGIKN